MSYQIPSIQKINKIGQLTDTQIEALATNDIICIDKSDSNPKYVAKTITDIFPAAIKTNLITSIAANDNLTLDALGTGKIILSSLSNGGVRFQGSNLTNWANFSTNVTGSEGVITGVFDNSTDQRPSVGANNTAFTIWAPLWINQGSQTIMGDIARASLASAPFVDKRAIVEGKFYATSDIDCGGSIKLGINTGHFHSITNTGLPGIDYTHTLPNANGTISQLGDVPACLFSSVAGISLNGIFARCTSSSISKLEFSMLIDTGDTVEIRVTNTVTSAIVMTMTNAATTITPLIYRTTTITTPVNVDSQLHISFNKTSGGGASALYSATIYK